MKALNINIRDRILYKEEICHKINTCSEYLYLLKEMDSIRYENEKLREIFSFAAVEFDKRNKKIELLEEKLLQANNRIKTLVEENETLRKKLQEQEAKCNILQKMIFGRKTEKKEEEVKIIDKKRGARNGHKGYGRKIPENLPVVEKVIDLPQEQKCCQVCGKAYEETGLEEVSSEICVKKIYYVKKIKRKKYKKTCFCQGSIITAPALPKLIPKGKFSKEFWIDTLLNKYKNHLPIERQVQDMREYGLQVSCGTIFGGLKKIYSLYLEPLYKAMIRSIREASHFHADESGWHLFVKTGEKKNYNWYIWVFISKDISLFVVCATRSARVPLRTLFDIEDKEIKTLSSPVTNSCSKKIMSVDKFSSYKMLERLGLVELVFCWAHQRREFIEAKTKYPDIKSWADTWIKKIAEIYHINNERIKYNPESNIFKEYDEELRKHLGEIFFLINQEYTHPGQIAIMNSMKEHWKGLTLFVDNTEIPMDNNLAERMLRPMVLGRKNYWGNHSLWAGDLTCCMFSIIQTCLIHKISPRVYLTYYFDECLKRGSPPDEIESFLPHKLTEETKRKIRDSPPA